MRTSLKASMADSSVNDRYSILVENAVMGNNGEALNRCLCDEHSVKGVAMVRGQISNSVSMVHSDWKHFKRLSLQYLAETGGDLKLAHTLLYPDLPDDCGTDESNVADIGYLLPGDV